MFNPLTTGIEHFWTTFLKHYDNKNYRRSEIENNKTSEQIDLVESFNFSVVMISSCCICFFYSSLLEIQQKPLDSNYTPE